MLCLPFHNTSSHEWHQAFLGRTLGIDYLTPSPGPGTQLDHRPPARQLPTSASVSLPPGLAVPPSTLSAAGPGVSTHALACPYTQCVEAYSRVSMHTLVPQALGLSPTSIAPGLGAMLGPGGENIEVRIESVLAEWQVARTHTHLSKRLRPACINPPRHVVPGATSRAGSRMLSYPVVVASLPRISAAHWQPRTRASTGTRTCTNAGTHTRTRTRENTRAHVFLCGKVKRQLLCASMRPEPGRLHPSPSYIILRLIQSTAICSA